jgi:hypothetical protein
MNEKTLYLVDASGAKVGSITLRQDNGGWHTSLNLSAVDRQVSQTRMTALLKSLPGLIAVEK